MNPERWRQLEELFHAALEREPPQRASFVAEVCGSDDDLRHELESMLDHHGQAKSFVESPAYEMAAESIIKDHIDELIGKTLGSYQIVDQLGKGGMGIVYLATDQKLQRKVALKILPADLTGDPWRVQRFKQEARAASALNHPNILTIFEIEESDGQHYIATEFVEGVTLRELIEHKDMSLHAVLDASVQIASALSAAHAAGIVHRDIKPENIMRRTDGYIKVLDFGLAKLSEQLGSSPEASTAVNTDPGIIIGTVQYMSPEQLRRLDLDARTDLWSLGVVLYEMVAGQSPFKATSESDVVASILQRKPSYEWRLEDVPPQWEWILKKALSKDREERYQTARDLLIDLKRLRREIEFDRQLESCERIDAGPRGGKPVSLRTRSDAPAEGGKKTSRAPSGSARRSPSASRRRSRGAINSLAVMPLVNASADPNAEYLSDGITESIINNLSQLPNLRVMARSTVFRYKGREVDPQQIGAELGVHAVLTGRVLQLSDSLVIGAELVKVSDGSQLWGQHFNRKPGDIFAVQEEISNQISEKLQMQLSGEERERLAKRHTQNAEAYQLYLKGRYHWNKRVEQGMTKSIQYFEAAIEIDPNYALAYAGLADSYIILGFYGVLSPNEVMPKAKAAANKALELDDTLAEAHISRSYAQAAYDWNWSVAERGYKKAIKLNTNYATAHHWYGEYLALVGRADEASAELARAHELDPLSLIIGVAVGWIHYLGRRYDDAIERFFKTLELDPNFFQARLCLGLAYIQKSMFEPAIAEFQKVLVILGRDPGTLAALGYAYGVSGKKSEARKLLDELKEQSAQRYIAPYRLAMICAGLGEHDQAFQWLQKGCDERDLGLACLKVEPMADSIRSDPRFEQLLRRVGFSN
jgi:serine/threonine protein kinase/tetratricopeptide (TPR) repeat protein